MPTTTQRRSRLQHGYCIGVLRRSAQATAGKGLAQGPYVTARAGVEPTTLRLRVIASTNAPSRPTVSDCCLRCLGFMSPGHIIRPRLRKMTIVHETTTTTNNIISINIRLYYMEEFKTV